MDYFDQITDDKITEIRIDRSLNKLEEQIQKATSKLAQAKNEKNLKGKENFLKELEGLFYNLSMNTNLLKNFIAYNMDPEDAIDFEDKEEIWRK